MLTVSVRRMLDRDPLRELPQSSTAASTCLGLQDLEQFQYEG